MSFWVGREREVEKNFLMARFSVFWAWGRKVPEWKVSSQNIRKTIFMDKRKTISGWDFVCRA